MLSRRLLPSAVAALVLPVLAAPAGAATFTVTKTADVPDPTPAGRSLREAVQEAGVTPEDDTIRIPRGNYGLASGELALNSANGKFTIAGTGARNTAIDGGDLDRIFSVPVNAVLDLSAVTVRNGKVSGEAGGGINSDGAVRLTDVAVTGNKAEEGAGIASTGSLTLIRSTVSGNIATGGGGGIDATDLTLVNSTVSGNNANGPGAGIAAHGGAVTLQNSTVTGNDGGPGGRGLDLDGASATAANSVIAGNPRGDCRTVFGGSIASQGGNLAGDTACGFGPAVDPRLGQLADNGGQTNTHALLTASPAIDAGTGPGCPATDQRGVPRPQGQACDSGAFEAAPVAVTGPRADTVAPRITALTVSNGVFMVRRSGRAAQASARGKRVVPKGTRFRFRLSESGGVAFTIERRTRGRRVRKRCRATTRGNRARPRCVRWVAVRRFVRAGVAGRNSAAFSGRIARGRRVRALKASRYRATVRASDAAGNRSKAVRVSFRVVR